VSEPDPLNKHYNVPTGAYPTTTPYPIAHDASPGVVDKSFETAHSALNAKAGDGGLGLTDKERRGGKDGESPDVNSGFKQGKQRK